MTRRLAPCGGGILGLKERCGICGDDWVGVTGTGYRRSLLEGCDQTYNFVTNPMNEECMSEAAGTSPIRLSQELTIFHDVAKALTSSLNLDSILQTIMEKMAEYFRPDTWSLLMVDEEKDELYFAIAVGAAAEALSQARLKMGEGIAGWVARHGQLLIVPDVQSDPRFSSRLDEITRLQTRSVICVPLRSKHRVLGVIQLVNANVGMSEQETFFLQTLCDYAAISIENARSVEKIQELTITDDCTGLFNARHLHKTLETEVYRSARFGYQFSLIFIDLDHFKQVNDTHGHLVGSRLLSEVGYLIKAQLRLIDFAFRYGGDEFVVLLPQTSKDQAVVVAKRLQDSVRAGVFCTEQGLNLKLRASMGLATFPNDAQTPQDIIRQADEMMYVVKNTTRDNIGIASRGLMET
jgi:diguanylate cyclase (GGDEF)-like protein